MSLVPTAPPAHVSLSALLEGEGDLLSLEPPVWVPDSHASACTRCKQPFRYALCWRWPLTVSGTPSAAPRCGHAKLPAILTLSGLGKECLALRAGCSCAEAAHLSA